MRRKSLLRRLQLNFPIATYRGLAPTLRKFGAPKAKGGLESFDYQLGWPYIALALESVCVVLHQRAPLAIVAVLLVLFQSPADNQFLKTVANSGLFARYKDAKFFCGVLTAWTFVSFLVVSYLLARV
jgi:hypothetical protein